MVSKLGEVPWGPAEHLMATVIDSLAVGNWQRSGDKNAPRPKPVPRPGAKKRMSSTEALERLADLRRRDRERRGE